MKKKHRHLSDGERSRCTAFYCLLRTAKAASGIPLKDKGKEVDEELRRSAVREQEVLTIFQQDYKI